MRRSCFYFDQLRWYRRLLIERAVAEARGNRTRAAAILGLQRTYLLRLIRELSPEIPPPRRGRGVRV